MRIRLNDNAIMEYGSIEINHDRETKQLLVFGMDMIASMDASNGDPFVLLGYLGVGEFSTLDEKKEAVMSSILKDGFYDFTKDKEFFRYYERTIKI